MRLIAGGVFWDAAPPTETVGVACAIARAAGAGEPDVVVRAGSASAVSTLGRASIETTDDVWIVTDADLTNLAELGGRLTALYARDGAGFVRRLEGAFALALYDRRRRTLLLAVDRFGIGRLYYASDARRTVFGSRPGALRASPGVDGAVDPNAVFSYLNFGCVPAPGSVYAGLRRLTPGELVQVRDGHVDAEPYGDVTYTEQPVRRGKAAANVYRVATSAVARALDGTTPKETGAFLSGGTDSSTVVGLMGRITGEQVNAFSIGFGDKRYDERSYAELAARHFGAAHYTRTLTPEDALAALPRLVDAYDEPFANNSALGTLACAELARDCGITCLLAGDGGDEIFGGNERYRTDRIYARYHRIPAAVRRLLEPVVLGLPGVGPLGRAQRYVRRANVPNPRRFYAWEFFVAQDADRLLAPDFLDAVDREAPWSAVHAWWDRTRGAAELNRLLYLDLRITLGDSDLVKVTRTAELAGIRVRFPFLDRALVDYMATLPAGLKVCGLEKRHLFRRAFREVLPAEVLAKRKHGFGVPTSAWLNAHPRFRAFARDTALSARARQRGYFRPGAIERLFELHATDGTAYYGDILWTVLMLELWHRRHVDAVVAGT